MRHKTPLGTRKEINFAVSNHDMELIGKIADRWHKFEHHQHRKRMDVIMDLCAVQNSCPLDLAGLLNSPDFDFVHDVAGIERHLDRETGQLTDCFLPRSARN